MTPTAYHHGNVRSAMLARAAQAVEQDGVEGLSLRQLARDIGVSHGAPSRHFRDKQALLDSLAFDGFTAMNAVLGAAAATVGGYRERLDSLAGAYVSFAIEHPVLLSVMYATKHHPDASEALRDVSRESLRPAVELIRAGQADGALSGGDAEQLALVSFASVHGVAMLATNSMLDGVPVEVAVSALVDLLWAGLTASASLPRASR